MEADTYVKPIPFCEKKPLVKHKTYKRQKLAGPIDLVLFWLWFWFVNTDQYFYFNRTKFPPFSLMFSFSIHNFLQKY